MKIIKPLTMTDAMLTSSSAPETDYTEWNSGTAYVTGNRCIRATLHKVYECIVGNTNNIPENNLTGATPKWLEVGSTNRWKMFDPQWGTQTSLASPLVVVLTPGVVIDSLALLNVQAEQVNIRVSVAGVVVYERSESMVGATGITDWYAYFFSEITYKTDLVFTDLLPYSSGIITLTFTASTGDVKCGCCIAGSFFEIGEAQYGAKAGIIDYSTKTTDAFGNSTITPRKYSKRNELALTVDTLVVDDVFNTLAAYRSTPLVWIGAENLYTVLIVYGFYKDFDVTIAYPAFSICTLTIEGLT